MGVVNLWQILAPVQQHKPLTELKGLTLAVDLSVWVCEAQGVKHMQGTVTKPHLRNLFFRISQLTQMGIKLVFVIEGTPPELKWEAMMKRQQARFGGRGGGGSMRKSSRSQFSALLRECCELLDYMGIPYIQSSGEAEAMCALLDAENYVDGCLTDDGDAFLYGARTVYRNFTLNTKDPHVESYSMDDIERTLKLDREKLIGLALLLGCDYSPKGVPGIGKEMAMKFIQAVVGIQVLERFRIWKKQPMNVVDNGKKPVHCTVCGHPGKTKDHEKSGCGMCGSDSYCEPCGYDYKCSCDWHQREALGSSAEMLVKKKALTVPGFPQEKIIKEFLNTKDRVPSTHFKWSKPKLSKLQAFNFKKLEWPEDYTRDKVLPLVTMWDMKDILSHGKKNYHISPVSIVKCRVRQGIPCYEIQWEKLEEDVLSDLSLYTTIEEKEIVNKCFPLLVEKYELSVQEKNATRKSKKKGKKSQSECNDEQSNVNVEGLTDCIENLRISSVEDEIKTLYESVKTHVSIDLTKSDDDFLQENSKTASSIFSSNLSDEKYMKLNTGNRRPLQSTDNYIQSTSDCLIKSTDHTLCENKLSLEKENILVKSTATCDDSSITRRNYLDAVFADTLSDTCLDALVSHLITDDVKKEFVSFSESDSEDESGDYLPLSQRLKLTQPVRRKKGKVKKTVDDRHAVVQEIKRGARSPSGSGVSDSQINRPVSTRVEKAQSESERKDDAIKTETKNYTVCEKLLEITTPAKDNTELNCEAHGFTHNDLAQLTTPRNTVGNSEDNMSRSSFLENQLLDIQTPQMTLYDHDWSKALNLSSSVAYGYMVSTCDGPSDQDTFEVKAEMPSTPASPLVQKSSSLYNDTVTPLCAKELPVEPANSEDTSLLVKNAEYKDQLKTSLKPSVHHREKSDSPCSTSGNVFFPVKTHDLSFAPSVNLRTWSPLQYGRFYIETSLLDNLSDSVSSSISKDSPKLEASHYVASDRAAFMEVCNSSLEGQNSIHSASFSPGENCFDNKNRFLPGMPTSVCKSKQTLENGYLDNEYIDDSCLNIHTSKGLYTLHETSVESVDVGLEELQEPQFNKLQSLKLFHCSPLCTKNEDDGGGDIEKQDTNLKQNNPFHLSLPVELSCMEEKSPVSLADRLRKKLHKTGNDHALLTMKEKY